MTVHGISERLHGVDGEESSATDSDDLLDDELTVTSAPPRVPHDAVVPRRRMCHSRCMMVMPVVPLRRTMHVLF